MISFKWFRAAQKAFRKQQDGRRRRGNRNDGIMITNAGANLTLDDMAPGGASMEEVEEEGWGAFDPDADMKDDDDEEEEDVHMFLPEEEESDAEGVENNRGRESTESRVELVRGANDSVSSDRQLRVNETPLKVDDSKGRPEPSSAYTEAVFDGDAGACCPQGAGAPRAGHGKPSPACCGGSAG